MKRSATRVVFAFLLSAPTALVIAAVASPPAQATATITAYNSTITPLPGNLPSVGVEAYYYNQLGNRINLAGPATGLNNVVVTMSDWACQSGSWTVVYPAVGYCSTTPGSTFSLPITFTIYAAGSGGNPGAQIATETQTFTIPYRPTSTNTNGCDGQSWWDAAASACYHGLADNITFNFSSQSVVLPSSVVYGISYNTDTNGPAPLHGSGNPADSLNVALTTEPTNVTVGSDTNPGYLFMTQSPAASSSEITCSAVTANVFKQYNVLTTGAGPCGLGASSNVPAVQFNVNVGSTLQEYVAPAVDGGVDTGTCTLASAPCATISYALAQEAANAPNSTGSVINLSKGTYSGTGQSFTLVAANGGVTISGAGKGTIFLPTACSELIGPGPDGSAMVNFGPAIDGVTVENMQLDGAAVAGCAGYTAGVIDYGPNQGNAVVGTEIESGTLYGILNDNGAQATDISNNLSPILCSAKVTGPNTGLNANWAAPANLKVNKIPKCALFTESGHGNFTGVFINGVKYNATLSATGKVIVLTSTGTGTTGGFEISKGSTVIYNTSAAPFLQYGIACNSPLTTVAPVDTECAISDNTVTGGGTVYGDVPGTGFLTTSSQACEGAGPIGIVATAGATANIDSNSVSDISDSISECPEPGETAHDGIGIGVIPGAGGPAGNTVVGVNDKNNPATGDGNKLGSTSANDTGIVVAGAAAPGGPYQVNGNTVTAANESGIVLEGLNPALNPLASDVENNSVTGVLTGVGFALFGDNCLNGFGAVNAGPCAGFGGNTGAFGGPTAASGNSATGDGLGLLVACDPTYLETEAGSACVGGAGESGPSDLNLIENNTLSSNELYGSMVVGAFQPEEIAAQTAIGPLESAHNVFNDNTWTGNGAGAPLVNGANVMDGTSWAGNCAQEGFVDCNGTTTLTYEGGNATFPTTSNTTPFTLLVCNNSTTAMPLKPGTEITFYPGGNTALSGTFFVTSTTIAQPNGQGGSCNTNTYPYTSLSLQALNPAKVGTDVSPTGQPYILGTGALITINSNGAAIVADLNTYNTGGLANSCTPNNLPTSSPNANIFGTTNGVGHPSSTTLDAGTGGVNATYNAC